MRAQGAVVVAAAGNDNSSAPVDPSFLRQRDQRGVRRATAHQGAVLEFWLDGRPGRARRRHDAATSTATGSRTASTARMPAAAARSSRPRSSCCRAPRWPRPMSPGVIALMLSANTAATPEQIDTLLAQGSLTDDIGLPTRRSRDRAHQRAQGHRGCRPFGAAAAADAERDALLACLRRRRNGRGGRRVQRGRRHARRHRCYRVGHGVRARGCR